MPNVMSAIGCYPTPKISQYCFILQQRACQSICGNQRQLSCSLPVFHINDSHYDAIVRYSHRQGVNGGSGALSSRSLINMDIKVITWKMLHSHISLYRSGAL